MCLVQKLIQIDGFIEIFENLIFTGIAVGRGYIRSVQICQVFPLISPGEYLLQWHANATMQHKTAQENDQTNDQQNRCGQEDHGDAPANRKKLFSHTAKREWRGQLKNLQN